MRPALARMVGRVTDLLAARFILGRTSDDAKARSYLRTKLNSLALGAWNEGWVEGDRDGRVEARREAMADVADRIREQPGRDGTDLLAWLDQEARRS